MKKLCLILAVGILVSSPLYSQTDGWTVNTANTNTSTTLNVGIGTATTNNKVEVGSAALGTLVGTGVAVSNTAGNSVVSIGQSSSARARWSWYYNATEANAYSVFSTMSSGMPLVLQDQGGNLCVGTVPNTLLHLMKSGVGTIGPEVKMENSGNAVGDQSALTFADNHINRAQIRSTVEGSPWAGTLEFYTGFNTLTEAMHITGDGRVGIGMVPAAGNVLDVNGNIRASGSITGARVLGATYQDLAEWVPSGERLAPGTVVIINSALTNEVVPSSRAYDTAVAGVVSAQPGVILGVEGPSKSQIATTGRVRVRVDATKHPIAAGDLLVTSERPGVAMVSEPVDLGGIKIHRPGTIIGKALEPLARGEGEILMLLSLQ